MFSDRDKLIALAIVHIFETAKPFGDYSAVAVLNDGAGISYGINQFTHRSGSLIKVISEYLKTPNAPFGDTLRLSIDILSTPTVGAIKMASSNENLKQALKFAGQEPAMQAAQRKVADALYLTPAIAACDGSHFTLPLSLAVIYDSINHGSYQKIRDEVTVDRTDHGNSDSFEKAWIAEYVHLRDAWLASVPRLAVTRYRTRLFLNLIRADNWQMDLPITVQGVRLTDAMINVSNSATAPAVKPTLEGTVSGAIQPNLSDTPKIGPPPTTPSQIVQVPPTPLYIKIGALFTFLTGLGINAGTLIQQKLTELTPLQVFYCVAALGLCYFAVEFIRRERKAKTQLTNKLVDAASDPTQNTVELQK
jgi:hypothetical protein